MTRRTKVEGQKFLQSEEYACIIEWFRAGNVGNHTDVPTTLPPPTAYRYLRKARKLGVLYLARWERRHPVGPPVALLGYQTGGLPDAPRPPRTPEAERVSKWALTPKGRACRKRSRQKRKNDPDRNTTDRMYHRARYARNNPKTVEKIDPLLAILTRKK